MKNNIEMSVHCIDISLLKPLLLKYDFFLYTSRFNIHLQTGAALRPRDNCPLHISVRPNESSIVRNHLENQIWGVEERYGSCPIHLGQSFEILILAEHAAFKVFFFYVLLC